MYQKDLNILLLLDFYGDILTEKQRDAIELYYAEDLSLAEISQHANISRQGVRDCIKRAEATLTQMENKLGLAKRFEENKKNVEKILEIANDIKEISKAKQLADYFGDKVDKIIKYSQEILK